MENKSKRKKIFRNVIILIIIGLVLGKIFIANKSEKYITIKDTNLEENIETLLKNFFRIENFNNDIGEFLDTSNVGSFFTKNDERLIYIYEKRFLVNLKRNFEKRNVNFDIDVKEICKGEDNKLKVLFNYDRSFNLVGRSEESKEQYVYEIILVENNNSLKIEKIYEVDALKKDSLFDVFYSKDKLYDKYIENEVIKYKNLSRMYL
ncbi:hypothetical protein [Clostridium sp. B9]|uniref:hypothetical protein n=1 Tax=Clostridium sp. B9 TaxID=3423224 RepID=UPI003D2F37B4